MWHLRLRCLRDVSASAMVASKTDQLRHFAMKMQMSSDPPEIEQLDCDVITDDDEAQVPPKPVPPKPKPCPKPAAKAKAKAEAEPPDASQGAPPAAPARPLAATPMAAKARPPVKSPRAAGATPAAEKPPAAEAAPPAGTPPGRTAVPVVLEREGAPVVPETTGPSAKGGKQPAKDVVSKSEAKDDEVQSKDHTGNDKVKKGKAAGKTLALEAKVQSKDKKGDGNVKKVSATSSAGKQLLATLRKPADAARSAAYHKTFKDTGDRAAAGLAGLKAKEDFLYAKGVEWKGFVNGPRGPRATEPAGRAVSSKPRSSKQIQAKVSGRAGSHELKAQGKRAGAAAASAAAQVAKPDPFVEACIATNCD